MSRSRPLTDKEFGQALEAARPMVAAFARERLNDPDDQEDLVQQIMARAWANRAQFKGTCKVSTWVHAIARNELVTLYRRRDVRRRTSDQAVGRADVRACTLSHEAAVLNDVTVSRLLRSLPEPSQEVFRMCHDAQMEPTEVAEALGMSAGTIRARLCRGRRILASQRDCA